MVLFQDTLNLVVITSTVIDTQKRHSLCNRLKQTYAEFEMKNMRSRMAGFRILAFSGKDAYTVT